MISDIVFMGFCTYEHNVFLLPFLWFPFLFVLFYSGLFVCLYSKERKKVWSLTGGVVRRI